MIIPLKGPLPHALRDLSALVLFSLGLLALSAPILGAGRLHLNGFGASLNDQVGYITTARKLAETGRLSCSCHYPSLLSQQTTKDYLYMPGLYCLLAGSYRLFGYGVLQSELPSLVCYVATNLLTYLIATRVYGRRVGLLASLLVAAYPPNLVFAFTAMMETAVVAAAMAALCAFVYLPRERRPYLTPLVLIIPFLFRETTAFLALPMALIISRDGPRPRPVRAMAFLLASVVVLTIVYKSDLSRGRGSFVNPQLSGIPEERIYTSITAGSASAPTARVLIKALAANAWCNARFLRHGLSWFDPFELHGLSVLFLTDLLVLVCLLRRGAPPSGPTDEGRTFPIAALAFSGINIAAILILYKFVGLRGLRNLMITAPPCLIAVAAYADGLVSQILARMTPTVRKWGVPALAVLLVAALMGYEYRKIRPRIIEKDPKDDADLVALESLRHDDSRMLVASCTLAMRYVIDHFPVPWSFEPSDRESLDLMMRRYDIGTLVITPQQAERLSQGGDLPGFERVRSITMPGTGMSYLVYKRSHLGPNGPPGGSCQAHAPAR